MNNLNRKIILALPKREKMATYREIARVNRFNGHLIKFYFNDFHPYKPSARYIDCVEAIKFGIGEYDKSKGAK